MANEPLPPLEGASGPDRTNVSSDPMAPGGERPEATGATTGGLGDDLRTGFGEYGRKAADGIEQLSRRLEDVDFNQIRTEVNRVVSDVERFARERPALFAGAAFAVGLIVGRIMRGSSARVQSSTAGGGKGVWEGQRTSSGLSSSYS
jgi:hypothetical protein